jgi:hypothetical protein
MLNNMDIQEDIEKITDDYGQLHEQNCSLNNEEGSDDGCDCAVKEMVKEVITRIITYLSYDMNLTEEQRKESVKMYLEAIYPSKKSFIDVK